LEILKDLPNEVSKETGFLSKFLCAALTASLATPA